MKLGAEMNAATILEKISHALTQAGIEAIIIGNSGAALNGAPVTTLDIDIFVRNINKLREKIKYAAKILKGSYIPSESELTNTCKIINEEEDIYIDIIDSPDGIKSFASVRSRSTLVKFGNSKIYVAALKDIIASKKAANRPKDKAVMEILEKTLEENKKISKAEKS